MKNLFLITFLLVTISGLSQNSFVDQRDQQTYGYYTINDLDWMTENLKYTSPNSYCKAIRPKDKICEAYNFFPKRDLKNVCPEGWRMPTELEWDNLFAWYYRERIKLKGAIKLDTMEMETGVDTQDWYEDSTKKLDLFAEENPMNFYKSNWVEGKKKGRMQSMTMWITDGSDNFHVHMGSSFMVKHTHKHHIEDIKKKQRQFVVRCVRPINN